MLSPLVRPSDRGCASARPSVGSRYPGKLGRENAMRNPRRTASTASALMIGLGLVSMVAILSASLKASFDQALTETLRADFMLSTSTFTSFSADGGEPRPRPPGGRGHLGVPAERVPDRRDDGVRDGRASPTPSTPPRRSTSLRAALADLAQPRHDHGLCDDVAKDNGWAVGDTIPAQFATVGDAPLTLVGIYGDNRLIGDYADLARHVRHVLHRAARQLRAGEGLAGRAARRCRRPRSKPP